MPTAYSALAQHAKKVLYNNVDNNRVDDFYYDDELVSQATQQHPDKKHYAFSYTVKDKASGDDFSHSQSQVDGAVKGSYKVQLPDGRMQIVSYVADHNGYRADVKYENEHGQVVESSSAPAPAPVASPTPVPHQVHHQHQQQPEPIQEQYYHEQEASPSPYYHHSSPVLNVKIHSYNTAPHKQEGYSIGPTVPSYYGSTTGVPLQIQSNHLLDSGPSTTPIPQYQKYVKAVYPSHASYISQKEPIYDFYNDYDSHNGYIAIQESPKYRRSSDDAKVQPGNRGGVKYKDTTEKNKAL